MRCYWNRAVSLLIATCILVFLMSKISEFQAISESKIIARTVWQSQEKMRSVLPFNLTIQLLAGKPLPYKQYLTVGLSSVKRKKESYLLNTLQSIFSQSSPEELAQIVVVVLLAEFDANWVMETMESISKHFKDQLDQGLMLVIHTPQDQYPPLVGLKRNFNDPPDRVAFRSKQNVDYASLVHFSRNLSDYFIMLEDDVKCSKRFLTTIKKHIHSRGSSPWVTLEYSKLGYIGKLYHSMDLPLLARFLFLFYQEMPCDFLLSHFRTLLMQDKVIRYQPSLFQHMGTYSSFQGNLNHLKDSDFHESPADNPPADIHTDIIFYQNHRPENAYTQSSDFFWGKAPTLTNYFLVAFHSPVILSRIVINTGSKEKKDFISSAVVEAGLVSVRTGKGLNCLEFFLLGSFKNGQFEMNDVQKVVKSPFSCLRIRVTKDHDNWIIIQNIYLWTAR
uniref:Alpha-1,3-mannosyl-glycoprotein 4-beta-N-acetylglucosaminyltransferase C n=1 Tax=Denticeps clupeoides TaxID=299321 RepID=A0AAY4CMG5_9TELE